MTYTLLRSPVDANVSTKSAWKFVQRGVNTVNMGVLPSTPVWGGAPGSLSCVMVWKTLRGGSVPRVYTERSDARPWVQLQAKTRISRQLPINSMTDLATYIYIKFRSIRSKTGTFPRFCLESSPIRYETTSTFLRCQIYLALSRQPSWSARAPHMPSCVPRVVTNRILAPVHAIHGYCGHHDGYFVCTHDP